MSAPPTAANDRGTDTTTEPGRTVDPTLRWGAALLVIAGIGFVANGVAMLYRARFSAGFEAGVHSLGGVTRAELATGNPALVHYLDHLHVNVAGLLVAVGIAVIALAWFGVRRGERWAWGTAIGVPTVFLAHSLPVHGNAGFSFDALAHLGPGLVWLPALLVGGLLSYAGLRSAGRPTSSEAPRDR